MSGEVEENVQRTIRVHVTTEANGRSEVRFSFPERDTGEEAPQLAKEPDKSSTAKEVKKFSRKPLDPAKAQRAFHLLSHEWLLVAIGFFEIVPELSRRNVEYAGADRTSRILNLLSELSIASSEAALEDGRVDREFSVTTEDFSIVAKALGRSRPSLRAATIMSRSSLLALVSEYEKFVSELITILARMNPGVLIAESESIPISSIEQFSSFDELMDDLIDTKVTDLLQANSHFKILKWIEDTFGVNLTSDETLIAEFVEVCQRRHLLAHAGGVVNKKYRRICLEHGFPEESLPQIGEAVKIDRKYLRRATARVFVVGLLTLTYCGRSS